MRRTALELLSSGVVVFVVSYTLAVPARGAWGPTQARFGEFALILGLVTVCVVSGAAFAALTGVRIAPFLAGGLIVYLGWWLYLEVTAGPFDSPAHVVLGAFFLSGFGVGAKLVEAAGRLGLVRRRDAFE